MAGPADTRRRISEGTGRSRRALLLYLLAIVGPTLVLLGLGLQTVVRQRHAVDRLSDANRRLTETALADAIERRVHTAAQRALTDPVLAGVVTADWTHPETVLAWRPALDALRRDHPVVRHLFVIQEGEVRLPRTESPLPRGPDALAAAEPPATRGRVRRLAERADALEHAGRLRQAIEVYAELQATAASPQVRAWALARQAACLDDTRERTRKASTWVAIVEGFRDTYDASGRPLALVAGVELNRLHGGAGEVPAALEGMRREFAAGRWPLTPEEAEYFSHALGREGALDLSPRFLAELHLARDLRTHFRHQGTMPAEGSLYALALPGGASLLYAARGRGGEAPTLMGLAIDEGWVREHVLRAAIAEVGLVSAQNVQLVTAETGGTPLRSVLPGLEVLVPLPQASRWWIDRDLLLFGSTTLVVLAVLLLGVVLLVRDVGRQEATSQLRSHLVGGVSHELKTPLSVIRMYAETLADEPEPARTDRRIYYDVIIHESVRLSHLIERVLDFSRVERGERPYVLVPGCLHDVVMRVAAQYAPYVRQQGFTLETAVAELPPVRLDAEAVSQGLIALVENALKYGGDDHRFIRIAARPRAGEAVVEVEDRGPGIRPDERDRIFARFYRGSGRSGRGGYGLGLYLVRHMMEAHGGRVEVDSEPGRGSRFRLVFPAME